MKQTSKPVINSIVKNTVRLTDTVPWKIIAFLPLFFSLIMIIILLLYFSSFPPQVPLYYSKPWGEDQLTDPRYLFILPLGSIIGYLISLFIIEQKTHEYRVFSQILLLFQSGMSGMALLIIINIIRLVT